MAHNYCKQFTVCIYKKSVHYCSHSTFEYWKLITGNYRKSLKIKNYIKFVQMIWELDWDYFITFFNWLKIKFFEYS